MDVGFRNCAVQFRGHSPLSFSPARRERFRAAASTASRPKGPGSAPRVPLDTTKGHRDDEKRNVREQGDHGNMVQNTSNRRSK